MKLMGLMLQQRRLWTSLVQALFSTMLVSRATIGTMPTTPVESCPVRLRSNDSAVTCVCSTTTINEITCSGGLDRVPEFVASDRVFHALYLSKQSISEVIQSSFTNLRVSLSTKWRQHFVHV